MTNAFIPATPYARLLAKEKGVDLGMAAPTGLYGAVRGQDVLALAQGGGKATPLAKRMAEDLGLSLGEVTGSGFGGKITKADILAYKPAAAPAAEAGQRRQKLSGMRKVIAARMLKSHTEIPPVTHNVKVDVTALLEARTKLNAAGGQKYSINDFVLKAVTKALMAHPNVLVSLDGEEIIYHEQVHLGMAVAVETGLVVPVIHSAESMSLQELAAEAKRLATRARENKLSPDAFSGSTFTVSNLGMFDVESFTPIVNQPNAAILGVCSIFDELALAQGAVCVRKVMRTSLTYDHRLLDGATAAKFQQEIKRLLENPIEIVM